MTKTSPRNILQGDVALRYILHKKGGHGLIGINALDSVGKNRSYRQICNLIELFFLRALDCVKKHDALYNAVLYTLQRRT